MRLVFVYYYAPLLVGSLELHLNGSPLRLKYYTSYHCWGLETVHKSRLETVSRQYFVGWGKTA